MCHIFFIHSSDDGQPKERVLNPFCELSPALFRFYILKEMENQSCFFHSTENLHLFKILGCLLTFDLWGKANISIFCYQNVSVLPLGR